MNIDQASTSFTVMTPTPTISAQDRTQQDRTQRAHQLAVLVYLLYLLGVLFGITALIGVIINHTKVAKTRDTHAYSHFIWQMASFWILFIGAALVVILWPASVTKLLIYACLAWWITSAIIGVWFLRRQRPIPFIKAAPDNATLKQTR